MAHLVLSFDISTRFKQTLDEGMYAIDRGSNECCGAILCRKCKKNFDDNTRGGDWLKGPAKGGTMGEKRKESTPIRLESIIIIHLIFDLQVGACLKEKFHDGAVIPFKGIKERCLAIL